MLTLRFLGELEVVRDGAALPLPPSKKTRALLAYLALTGRTHRRERLCSLLWEIPDDPRGALRWSLSKLRAVVDEPGCKRIRADRDTVAFEADGTVIDLLAVRARLASGVAGAPTEKLVECAGEFRGEFLEGLDLSDHHDFQAWCVAEREEARRLHAEVLTALADRFADRPDEALPYSRMLVQIDPFNDSAHAGLVRLLAGAGRRSEARSRLEAARRLLEEAGIGVGAELLRAGRELAPGPAGRGPASASPAPSPPPEPAPPSSTAPPPLVGRESECARLAGLLDEVTARGRARVALLAGEPGVGKTRLLAELAAQVRARGGTVLEGAAFEAESGRPYGPWIEALRRLPAHAMGDAIGAELAPLLPEIGAVAGGERSRDRLFGAVSALLAARAHSAAPVLVAFDDMQWCDEASAELLHYVVRMNRHRAVLVALAAREGELPDNPAMPRVLRGLRREGTVAEIVLRPLDPEATAALVRALAPDLDVRRVFAQSAGNPLFALELARSPQHADEGAEAVPPTLAGLVRERIENLPPEAADVLRWAAVLGPALTPARLETAASLDLDTLMSALAALERHALLRTVPAGRDGGESGDTYAFAHDVVRQVVYADISEPRRRLMHLRIAQALDEQGAGDESLAADIARHAALAGNSGLAARACAAAARRSLRLFANADAFALARRGMRYAESLPEPERLRLMLELVEIRIKARRPERPEETAREIEALAERALDHGCLAHARLGFHMLSYLSWEGGEWSAAERQTMRAEMVSRSADEKEHVVAMAEAARCLALLERDLARAESMVREAVAASGRLGVEAVALPDAMGMLCLHAGRLDEAARLFDEARTLARRDGDRLGEFQALEHLIMVALQRADFAGARALTDEIVPIAEKLREGSEIPFARTLAALARYALGDDDAVADLDAALEDLRIADAKHRLAFALTRAADIDLARGRAARARERARQALDIARLLRRPSETVLALCLLVRAAASPGDRAAARRARDELASEDLSGASAQAREAARKLLADTRTARPRRRRKVSGQR